MSQHRDQFIDPLETMMATTHSRQSSSQASVQSHKIIESHNATQVSHVFQQRSFTTQRNHQILPSRSTLQTHNEAHSITSESHMSDQLTILTGSTSNVDVRNLRLHTRTVDPMATYFQRTITYDDDGKLSTPQSAKMSPSTNAFRTTTRNGSMLGLTSRYGSHDIVAEPADEILPEAKNEQAPANCSRTATISGQQKHSAVNAFAEQCLEAHNNYRRRHGAPALQLDAELMEHAQRWANVLATMNRMEHNPKRRFGENVYSCAGFEPTGHQVVRTWYDEVGAYNFARPQFSMGTGHFTALVWCSTQRLGVGVQRSNTTGQYYVVANYDPAGNVAGHFEQNVLRPAMDAGPNVVGTKNTT